MALLKNFDKFFWIILLAGIVSGLTIPNLFVPIQGIVIYLVMSILFYLFLKVDVIEILADIRRPFFLLYVAFINLIVTPIIIYYTFRQTAGENIYGYVLLASLPAGVSSAAFTDIMKGRTSLTLILIVLTNLLAIVTIPLMFFVLFNKSLELDSLQMSWSLCKIFFIPFFLAKAVKHLVLKSAIKKIQDFINPLIVCTLSLMIAISVSFQANYVLHNLKSQPRTIGLLFVLLIISQMVAYFGVWWKDKDAKLAISNSNMIMNNVLGIVLSIAFFPENVTYIVILSLVPWTMMIIAKNWYQKFLP